MSLLTVRRCHSSVLQWVFQMFSCQCRVCTSANVVVGQCALSKITFEWEDCQEMQMTYRRTVPWWVRSVESLRTTWRFSAKANNRSVANCAKQEHLSNLKTHMLPLFFRILCSTQTAPDKRHVQETTRWKIHSLNLRSGWKCFSQFFQRRGCAVCLYTNTQESSRVVMQTGNRTKFGGGAGDTSSLFLKAERSY